MLRNEGMEGAGNRVVPAAWVRGGTGKMWFLVWTARKLGSSAMVAVSLWMAGCSPDSMSRWADVRTRPEAAGEDGQYSECGPSGELRELGGAGCAEVSLGDAAVEGTCHEQLPDQWCAADLLQGPGCIEAPPEVSFGHVLLGRVDLMRIEIRSCGEQGWPLLIFGLAIGTGPDLDDGFGVEAPDLDHWPTPGNPVVVPAGESISVSVTYVALELPPFVDQCIIPWDKNTLTITTNAVISETKINLVGIGMVGSYCSEATIACVEGPSATTGAMLHLVGSGSSSPRTPIVTWKWTVSERPPGSVSEFVPGDSCPDPTFVVDSAGKYRFGLDVSDCYGTSACFPAVYEVEAL